MQLYCVVYTTGVVDGGTGSAEGRETPLVATEQAAGPCRGQNGDRAPSFLTTRYPKTSWGMGLRQEGAEMNNTCRKAA